MLVGGGAQGVESLALVYVCVCTAALCKTNFSAVDVVVAVFVRVCLCLPLFRSSQGLFVEFQCCMLHVECGTHARILSIWLFTGLIMLRKSTFRANIAIK